MLKGGVISSIPTRGKFFRIFSAQISDDFWLGLIRIYIMRFFGVEKRGLNIGFMGMSAVI